MFKTTMGVSQNSIIKKHNVCPIGKCYDEEGLVLMMMQIVKINMKWNRYV